MPDARPTDPNAATPSAELSTVAGGVEEGLVLILKAEEAGVAKTLVGWLAKHPDLAGEVAQFLKDSRSIQAETAPIRHALLSEEGSELGGLVIGRKLGRGGMGVVNAARDPKLDREVAVKRLPPGGFASAADLEAFEREARAAALLDHPAIVKVFRFDREGGSPYLVMQLMKGGSLAQRLRECRRFADVKEAARLVRDVALGVHHAHQRGILHRDLKPGNVLLDAEGRPHVADFGLARLLGANQSLSLSGRIAGTPAYMAPEQARGDKRLTPAVDVHALGAILYELLVGEPPFGTGKTASTLKRVEEEDALPLRRLRSDAPADLEEVCRRCLAKRPEDRYPSAQALADDLTHYLEGEPIGRWKRGILSVMREAIGRRREVRSMMSWRTSFLNAGRQVVAYSTIQLLVVLGEPRLAYAVFMANLVLGVLLMWFSHVRHLSGLNVIERQSTVLHISIIVGYFALLPANLLLNGGQLSALFPALMVLMGLGVFANGLIYWGQMYLLGTLFVLFGALLPLLPPIWFPALCGAAQTAFYLYIGFRVRAFDRAARSRQAEAAAPSTPGP
jgi:serine/threonine protein kinase